MATDLGVELKVIDKTFPPIPDMRNPAGPLAAVMP